jgi:hypothetical protein
MPPLGAYGLALAGLAGVDELLVPAEPSWPPLELVSEVGSPVDEPEYVSDERAEILTRTGARITIDRSAGRALVTAGRPLTADELVHPFLAPAAAVVGGWLGRESFHCGAFVAGGGAWALLGERESGKSSTLAALALAGYGIVCDDILLLEGTACFPGPRCVDLREETAAALDAGDALGTVGGRERWRLPVPQLQEAPVLRGIVFLDWGDDFEAEPVPASRQLAGLLHHRALRLHSSVPEVLLELAALPAWELRRPRRLDSLGGTVDRLADLVSAA